MVGALPVQSWSLSRLPCWRCWPRCSAHGKGAARPLSFRRGAFQAAVGAGSVTGEPPEPPPLPDEGVRGVAATYLGIVHEDPTASVPLLAQGLEDPDPTVRRASATALGSFGADAASALPALRKAAVHQDPDLAREAGRSIVAVSGGK